jgi:hypothetical protein
VTHEQTRQRVEFARVVKEFEVKYAHDKGIMNAIVISIVFIY